MIDKNYCMSSFLAFRYIEKDNIEFYEGMKHKTVTIPEDSEVCFVSNENELDTELKKIFNSLRDEKLGLLLSGGMDSGCLASYMPYGTDAYTFRFQGGIYAADELKRAEEFASVNHLKLHYVDISWTDILSCLPKLMSTKGAPVHSIEPQIYLAAMQAKKDGITKLVIGDAADYVFYGMDGLLSKDWDFDAFVKRSMYLKPSDILKQPADVMYLYERYRLNDKIDFLGFYDKSITEESYGSYENALYTAEMPFIDPYELFKMREKIDLSRVRSGDSKYIIRALYRKRYPSLKLPEKSPMPRPVDDYFRDWNGPIRSEFRDDINMNAYSGNQKWLMFCLEYFLNIFDSQK